MIGIIDGYFDGQPAVWHKEVLWALSQGIAVFGASSMGALRAAELYPFGMCGVGKIFQAFRDGTLTDDDEVALIHGPGETGYLRLSEPMVNIRATLERAVSEHVIDRHTGDKLVAAAKAQFYQQRTWASVAAALGEAESAARFSTWLKDGRVDQKRDDALLMLQSVAAFLLENKHAELMNFSFEWTENWENAPWRTETLTDDERNAGEQDAILDELRLAGAYPQVRRDALLRMLAGKEIAALNAEPDRRAVAQVTMAFRSPRGLLRQREVQDWALENGTNLTGFNRMMTDNARIETLARLHDVELRSAMLDRLREQDRYIPLRDRARAKRQLASSGDVRADAPRVLLVTWYFGKRLGIPVPDDLDDYAASVGIAGITKFCDLLAADYNFIAGVGSKVTGARAKGQLT